MDVRTTLQCMWKMLIPGKNGKEALLSNVHSFMHLLFQPGQAQMLQNQPQEQSDVQYPVSKKTTTLHELQSTRRWSNSPTPTRRHIKSSRDVGELVLNPIQLS